MSEVYAVPKLIARKSAERRTPQGRVTIGGEAGLEPAVLRATPRLRVETDEELNAWLFEKCLDRPTARARLSGQGGSSILVVSTASTRYRPLCLTDLLQLEQIRTS